MASVFNILICTKEKPLNCQALLFTIKYARDPKKLGLIYGNGLLGRERTIEGHLDSILVCDLCDSSSMLAVKRDALCTQRHLNVAEMTSLAFQKLSFAAAAATSATYFAREVTKGHTRDFRDASVRPEEVLN